MFYLYLLSRPIALLVCGRISSFSPQWILHHQHKQIPDVLRLFQTFSDYPKLLWQHILVQN